MSRTFTAITMTDFEKKVNDFFQHIDENKCVKSLILDKLGKDIKVSFDWENFEWHKSTDRHSEGELIGYHVLTDGLCIRGCSAGGDWEHPVFFLIYWDGKKLRAYVPTEGNPWNTSTKQAFGNDEEADLKNARKRWPGVYDDAVECDDFEFHWGKIVEDISTRIKLVGSPKLKTHNA